MEHITFEEALKRIADRCRDNMSREDLYKFQLLKIAQDHKQFCDTNHPEGDCGISLNLLWEIGTKAGVKWEQDEFYLFM